MNIYHIAVKTRNFAQPFKSFEQAMKMWNLLYQRYPEALAACLMTDHFHIIIHSDDATQIENNLNSFLMIASRSLKLGPAAFKETLPPQLILNHKHLLRSIRYVHLNPCRDSLVKDPLEWPFSTHRDYLGLKLNPWPATQGILKQLRMSAEQFHQYTSGDPSVKIEGTHFPRAVKSTLSPKYGVQEHLDAANCLIHFQQNKRSMLMLKKFYSVALLMDQGFTQTGFLMRVLKLGRHQIAKWKRRSPVDPRTMELLRIYLNDPRLRKIKLQNGDCFVSKPG